jgi:transposase-like protein
MAFCTPHIVDMFFLDTDNLASLLSHLNKLEIKELAVRYWSDNDSVAEIIARYGLDCHPRQLVNALPFVITEVQCPYCRHLMVRKILSRSSRQKLSRLFCPHCQHRQASHCACFRCQKQPNALAKQALLSQARTVLDSQQAVQSITDLSLKDVVYLITLIRSSVTVSSAGWVGPVTYIPPLAPHDDKVVVQHLLERELITLSSETEDAAFIVRDEALQDAHFNAIEDLDFMAVKWTIHLEHVDEALAQLNASLHNGAWLTKWGHEVQALWRDIAVFECVEFLQHLAEERKFAVEMSDELQDILRTLLQQYSVSQCFSVIQDGVRDVSDSIVKETLPRTEAGRHLLQRCAQASTQKSAYIGMPRPYLLRQSRLSHVLHYDFLKIGPAGFTAIPHNLNG